MTPCKGSSLVLFYSLGLVSLGLMQAPAQAQIIEDYDPILAPYLQGDNPTPPDLRMEFIPPFNPRSPWGWAIKVLTTPDSAGSWDETSPSDPLDVNSDGHRDMSEPYYPSTWQDSNHDGLYDCCGL